MSRLRKKQEVAGKVGAGMPDPPAPPQQQQQHGYYQNQQQDPWQQQQGNARSAPPVSSNYYPQQQQQQQQQSAGAVLPLSAPPAYLSSQLQPYQSPYALPNINIGSSGGSGGGGASLSYDPPPGAADGGQLPAFLIESPRKQTQQGPVFMPPQAAPGTSTFMQQPSGSSFSASREVYSAQAPLRPPVSEVRHQSNGTLTVFGNENDGLPKFGRRARTTDGGPRTDKDERTLRYQQEIREQKEAAEAKKKAEKERERQEDLIFEQKMLADQQRLAEKERAEQAKERQERDEREAAKFGGRRDKNKPAQKKPEDGDGLQNELMKQIEEKKARKAEEERRKAEEDMKYEEKHRRQLQGGVQQRGAQQPETQPGQQQPSLEQVPSVWDPAQNQPQRPEGTATPVNQASAYPPWGVQPSGPALGSADAAPQFNNGPSPFFHPVDPALARQPNPRYPTTMSSMFSPTIGSDPYAGYAAASPLYGAGGVPSAYPPNFMMQQQQQQVAVNHEVSALRNEILGLLTQQQMGMAGLAPTSSNRPLNMSSPNPALPQSAMFVPVHGGMMMGQMPGGGGGGMMYGSSQQALVNPNDVLGQFMRDESMQFGGGGGFQAQQQQQQPNVFSSQSGNVSTNFLPLSGGGGGGSGGGGFDNYLQGYSRHAGGGPQPYRGAAAAPGPVDVSMELGSEPSQFVRLRR